jgi:hypothetical protein
MLPTMRDNDSLITEIAGSFSGQGFTEVLVSIPYKAPFESFRKIFIVSVSGNKFEFQNWFNKDCTSFWKTDLDNDGIDEIAVLYEGKTAERLHYKIFEIISLKGGRPEVVYERYSERGDEPDNFEHSKIGDTLSIWANTILIDGDHDGITEMAEVIACSTIKEIVSADSVTPMMHLDTLTITFQLRNGI